MKSTTKVLELSIVFVVLSFIIGTFNVDSVHSASAFAVRTKRVVAHGEAEISSAVNRGCKVVRDARTAKALVCPETVAQNLGLEEDYVFTIQDSGANAQIGADAVQLSGNTGLGTKIVVLDTGYNYNHVELASSYLGGYDFAYSDSDPDDKNGHGSHVAGLITADGINPLARGVAPDAGIIAGKIFSDSGFAYWTDFVVALYWAVDGPDGVYGTADDFDADAISASIGTSYKPQIVKNGYCDDMLPDITVAIKYAVDHGIPVIIAAGNNGQTGVSMPGCISYAITVGAVDSGDRIASFSGRGTAVDISAPGVSLFSSYKASATNNNTYATMSGTSMATPVVSGVVALIKAAHPEYTASQIEAALKSTSNDQGKPGWDSNYGWGRVNATKAVQ